MIETLKKHWQIMPVILVGAAFAGLLGYVFWPREPAYQGKRLHQWLEELYSGQSQTRENAKAAIRQMGTQTLPELLEMIQTKDSRFKVKLARLLGRQSMVRFRLAPAFERQNRAMSAFSVLGPLARPALGPLTQILNRGDTAFPAAHALVLIGPEACSALIGALTNIDRRVRYAAATGLGAAGSAAQAGVPALIRSLKDSDPDVRATAALALSRITKDAASVVPTLLTNLHDPHPAVRACTARALSKWGPAAKAAIPALSTLAQDPDRNVSNAAHEALGQIGP